MSYVSAFLAKDAAGIFPFQGHGLINGSREDALIKAMNELRCGEILRLFIDQNPITLINKLVVKYGSKLVFQYLQNCDGAVIIDFKKLGD
jgi:uncharacterized protein (DUF2249 family)